MATYRTVAEFLDGAKSAPVIDVRSPGEFQHAHVPGAHNVPLFDDSERAEVGTKYRQQGRIESVLSALDFVAPKMRELAESARELAVDGKLRVHCWRGGMRSRSFAWLVENVDLEVELLQGGYKAYRRHVLDSFRQPVQLVVLSGLTGAGKTKQLQRLRLAGQQVVDLESLANHRGSAFGGIQQGEQPTSEQFENCLAHELQNLDRQQPIWVEDESRNVGRVRIPHHFFDQLRSAPAIFLDVGREERTRMIMQDYGGLPKDELIAAVNRIQKRLGGQNVKTAVTSIESACMETAVGVLLDYYDRLYLANRQKLNRPSSVEFAVTDSASETITRQLIAAAERVVSG